MIINPQRFKVSPFKEKKAVEGWRGPLAISNQPRQRSLAELPVGWDGDLRSGSARTGLLAISNRPREEI
ncbi:hypothetical protein [Okeania sp. SIO2B9]|uniref:Uncharacterized protein n=1 Tax=Okeania hirsuta TaxID=1458930 RepID=A0A3N6RQK8_9CYAN|nr:hypothetical protein [Okeania sp. SIO2B9]NET20253.1 hypothetical protein [Okeania sp. SIO1H5]RQH14348.1 hypothetical protein D4Z78_23175 [Okeania hirsuta]RQH43395.1 hypothetical protein D5R40_13060 [Okeania hirsuta]